MSEWFRERKDPLSRIFEELEKMMFEDFPEGTTKERELPDGSRIRDLGPFTYGYSMRIGPDGKPEIEEFGNIRPPRRPQPFGPFKPHPPTREEMPGEKKLLMDVFTKNNEVKVIVEIPEVQESNIDLQCTGKSLTILVNNKEWRKIELPVEVNPKYHKLTYKNGILEVTLNRLAPEEQGDMNSKIRWL